MNQEILQKMQERLSELYRRQEQLRREIDSLRISMEQLAGVRVTETPESTTPPAPVVQQEARQVAPGLSEQPVHAEPLAVEQPVTPPSVEPTRRPLEEFLGTNVLNKIGIAVLIVGIGIGIRYAIDHSLISPLTRIILGYLAGFTLTGIAWRMKPRYEKFSAVLIAGGMATLYFVSFTAYAMYQLLPQIPTFVLMVAFTVMTVYIAMLYGLEVIAVIGMVGAYAVPFLLSDGSGKIVVLLTYISVINLGILALSYRRRWNILLYFSFGLTWLILYSWFITCGDGHEWLSLTFSTVFYVTFYLMLVLRKLGGVERNDSADTALLMINSVFCYTLGYQALDIDYTRWQGLYTLLSALPHVAVALALNRQKAQHEGTVWIAMGMALTFLTLAIPVQLDGRWVTDMWLMEAVILVWVSRRQRLPWMEYLGYVVLLLGAVNLISDWSDFYRLTYLGDSMKQVRIPLLLNVQFLNSLLALACVAALIYVHRKTKLAAPYGPESEQKLLVERTVVVLGVLIAYFSIELEIAFYWQQLFALSGGESDPDVLLFKRIWVLIYTMLFALALGWRSELHAHRWRSLTALLMATGALLYAITGGLEAASALTDSYLHQTNAQVFIRNINHVLIRYGLLMAAAITIWRIQTLAREVLKERSFQIVVSVLIHVSILALLSSELIHWLKWSNVTQTDTLALSLLWSAYAFGLVGWGFRNKIQLIRIEGMALFGITLLKLLFYDLSDMSTIYRTVVMVILGILMLVASFLYNKFRSRL
ncbi:MAG: DUF2339 domain-containing protein [Cyclobacteriaceae bacterium]|nr:DUF2339 domain-containing protein [Cyclobacteriaceae bacterium]